MKQYDNYKQTGIEWLNNVPAHWEKVRLRYLCDITTGKKDTINREEDGEYPFFVRSNTIERISTYSFDGEAILTAGDGDICKIWHHVNEKFDFHQRVYMLYNFKRIISKYLFYYISENFYYDVFKLSAKNTVDSLRLPMFLNFPVLLPSNSEQIQIANYLDYKIGIIDELILQKEKLIKLLKEDRQSIIVETITKGLNKDERMKESGVDWIGEVPFNWVLKRLKFLYRIKKEIAGNLGHDVLSVTQKGIKKRDLENMKGQLSMDYSKYQIVNKGDFIMNHMDLLTGFVDISKWSGVTSPDYRVFSPINKTVFDEYYLYIFQFCYSNKIFFGLGQGVSQLGRWRMPAESFNNFVVPFPSLDEQIEIVNFLNQKISSVDSIIEGEIKIIEKLHEYRKSIISEAVTGKIDVRDWQPPVN